MHSVFRQIISRRTFAATDLFLVAAIFTITFLSAARAVTLR